MTPLIIIAIILILLALLRYGAVAQYDENGLSLFAFVGPLRIRILPKSERAKQKAAEKKAAKKHKMPPKSQIAESEVAEETPKGGKVQKFKELYAAVSESLSRLRHRLLLNAITIKYASAGTDPAKAAMAYGYANAAMGALIPQLENIFRIKKRDISASVDFNSRESSIFARLKLSLSIWETVYIAAGLDIKKIRSILKGDDNTGKVEMNNG